MYSTHATGCSYPSVFLETKLLCLMWLRNAVKIYAKVSYLHDCRHLDVDDST